MALVSRNPTFNCWAVRTSRPRDPQRRDEPWVAIPPSVAGLFGRQTRTSAIARPRWCRNPTFSCWAVRTAPAPSRSSVIATNTSTSQSHLQLLGCSDGSIVVAVIVCLLRGSQSHLQLLGCSDGSIVVVVIVCPLRGSQSHLQLLGCSDRANAVTHSAGALILTKSQSHLQLLGCSDGQNLFNSRKLLATSQSHLQLLGCSDHPRGAPARRRSSGESQSHLQLLGCSDRRISVQGLATL